MPGSGKEGTMERDEELRHYKETLVHQLQSQQRLRDEATPEVFRIFVNHRCIGCLDCGEGHATFLSSLEGQEVLLLEVRTDSGLLVASASGSGIFERSCRIRVGVHHSLTLFLTNDGTRGTVKVSYVPSPAGSRRLVRIVAHAGDWLADRARKARRSFSELPQPMQVSLAFQMVLAIGFVYLLLHSSGGVVPENHRATQPQSVNPGTQQIATLTTDLAALAKDQQFLREQIASLEKSSARSAIEIEHRVERRLLPELQKATLEMVRVRQQVQELTTAKEAMKQDLAAVLKQQTETLARMKLPPSPEGPQSFRATTSPPLAQAEEPPKIAGGARPEEFKPLTFWVSFQEGTTEKHVQDLLHQFRGRKLTGPTPTGWINIEAQLKQSETIEGFFETLKKANIVRAITTSLTGQ